MMYARYSKIAPKVGKPMTYISIPRLGLSFKSRKTSFDFEIVYSDKLNCPPKKEWI